MTAKETGEMRPVSDSRFKERKTMIQSQLTARGISDGRVLEAMLAVQRHLFVPEEYQALAYADRPLPIGNEQTISQPYIVAYMLQSLELSGEEKVLEIGTGSGYAAALLSNLVREVYTVEIRPDLAASARKKIESLGIRNVFFRVGDGHAGWLERAPFDAVLFSACVRTVPDAAVGQVKEGGKIIAPLAFGKHQKLILFEKKAEGLKKKDLMEVSFVLASRSIGEGEA